MANNKKNTNKTNRAKKATSKPKKVTKKNEPSAENTFKEMKRLGFKTIEEYIDYIDSKRGY